MSVTVLRSLRYLVLATPLVASTLPGCGDAALRPELQSPQDVQEHSAALTDRDDEHGGAVYAMTNAVGNNAIVVYRRAADGTLTLAGAPVPTGGGGSGVQLDPTDSLGSQGGLMLDRKQKLLFAVNTETAAANTAHDCHQGSLSVFRIRSDGTLVAASDPVPSGGLYPSSLTVSNGTLYVLNAGGPDICTGSPGFQVNPNITGFSVSKDGRLARIANATQVINPGIGPAPDLCAPASFPDARFNCGLNPPAFPRSPGQLSFNPKGDTLVVTVKATNSIYLFPVGLDGTAGTPSIMRAPGPALPTYFGFAFDKHDRLVVSEPFGTATAIPHVPAGAVSSFELHRAGSLTAISSGVPDDQGTPCWVAMEPHDKGHAYIANNATSSLSVYAVADDGKLTYVTGADQHLATAGTESAHPNDLVSVADGEKGYLYSLNAGTGKVGMFRIQMDGTLAAMGEIAGLPASAGAQGLAAY